VTVLTSDFSTTMAAATVAGSYDNMMPQASLTAARDSWTADQVAADMRRQRDVIRANAGLLAWAGVGAEADARRMLLPRWEERSPTRVCSLARRPGRTDRR
jgi:hypothetical protein